MNLIVKIVGVVLVALIVTVAVLRIRKLRRDEIRKLANPVDRRLLTPPPSPYAPSKGFRLLDGPIDPQGRTDPARPRLESNREYVFSESQMPTYDDARPVALRHNETWALSRSARRSVPMVGMRVAVIALVTALLVGFVAFYVQNNPSHHGGAPSTTTTVHRVRTPPTSLPTSLAPLRTSGSSSPFELSA